MGSGDRLSVVATETFGVGLYVSRFPFAITVGLHVLVWHISVGFGKGYDEA